MSSSQSPRRSPQSQEKLKPNKIFVTNLEVDVPTNKIEEELQQRFSKYGKLQSVVVKKSHNNEYSYGFIQYVEGVDATSAVKDLNNTTLFTSRMKVELQDNSRRRKGGQRPPRYSNQACFVCGKSGHFARNCNQSKEKAHEKKSRSSSEHHKKKKSKKHRHRSSSKESRPEKKKDKKKHSKKIKKSKHKKHRKDSGSESQR